MQPASDADLREEKESVDQAGQARIASGFLQAGAEERLGLTDQGLGEDQACGPVNNEQDTDPGFLKGGHADAQEEQSQAGRGADQSEGEDADTEEWVGGAERLGE